MKKQATEFLKGFPKRMGLWVLPFLLISTPCALAEDSCQQVHWDKLKLTQAQRSEMSILDDQWHAIVNEVMPRIKANEKQLHHAMRSASPDESEIMQLEQAIHDDKAHLKMQATQIFLHKRKLLNPDQQAQLTQMLADH